MLHESDELPLRSKDKAVEHIREQICNALVSLDDAQDLIKRYGLEKELYNVSYIISDANDDLSFVSMMMLRDLPVED